MGIKMVGPVPDGKQELSKSVRSSAVFDKASVNFASGGNSKPRNEMDVNSFTTIATSAINAFNGLGNAYFSTIAAIDAQHQETERALINAQAQVDLAREQTLQIRIQEEEKTRRVIAECAKEVRLKELELEKINNEIKERLIERKISHKEFLVSVDKLDSYIKEILKTQDKFTAEFLSTKDENLRNSLLCQTESFYTTLVSLAGQIVSLRK